MRRTGNDCQSLNTVAYFLARSVFSPFGATRPSLRGGNPTLHYPAALHLSYLHEKNIIHRRANPLCYFVVTRQLGYRLDGDGVRDIRPSHLLLLFSFHLPPYVIFPLSIPIHLGV